MPSNRIIIPVGVTVEKNIIPMIIGETIEPRNKPSLSHNLFGSINNFGRNIAKKRKMSAIMQAHRCIFLPSHKGYRPIITKTIEKIRPKFLSELGLIL